MFLILAEPGDPLAAQVQKLFEIRGRAALQLSERELMEETPLAIERDGGRFGGLLRLPGGDRGDLPLADLSGVLVRMRRRWWPSSDFEPADQMFVYHETTAAMFCLLAGLTCPVINRFDLGWWLCDPAYPERLREELADRLGLPLAEPDPDREPLRVYAVDGRLIPASGEAVPFGDRGIGALAEWQRRSGLRVCRLDFSSGAEPALERIDPCPSLAGESPDLIGRIATATVATMEVLS